MAERVGIYAGAFDPVHQGHISFALQAARQCSLRKVHFLVEPNPRQKPNVRQLQDRVRLVSQATQLHAQLEHFAMPGQQFRVATTLPLLRRHFGNQLLTMLVGSDVVRRFGAWPNLAWLADTVDFAVGLRSGDVQEDIEQIIQQLSRQCDANLRITFVRTPQSHLTSTAIREGELRGAEQVTLREVQRLYIQEGRV